MPVSSHVCLRPLAPPNCKFMAGLGTAASRQLREGVAVCKKSLYHYGGHSVCHLP